MAGSNGFGPLQSQTKQVLYNIYKYFDEELAKDKSSVVTAAQLTAKSTGVSRSSIYKIIAESKEDSFHQHKTFSNPSTTKQRICPKALADSEKEEVRKIIYKYQKTPENFPSLKKIHEKLKAAIGYTASVGTLRLQVQELGFRRVKVKDNQWILKERQNKSLVRQNT